MRFQSDSTRVIVLVALRPRVKPKLDEVLDVSYESADHGNRTFTTHFANAPKYLTGRCSEVDARGLTDIMVGDGVQMRQFSLRDKNILVIEGEMLLRDRKQPRDGGGSGDDYEISPEDVENLFNAVGDAAVARFNEHRADKDAFEQVWVNRTILVAPDEDWGEWLVRPQEIEVGLEGLKDMRVLVGWGNNVVVLPDRGDAPERADGSLVRRAQEHVVTGLTAAQFAWLDLEEVSAGQAGLVLELQNRTLKRSDLERIERGVGMLSLVSIGCQTNVDRLHEWSQGLWGRVAQGLLNLWGVEKMSASIEERFDGMARAMTWRRDTLDSRMKSQVEVVAFALATLSVIDLLITVYEFATSSGLKTLTVDGRDVSFLEVVARIPADLWLAGAVVVVSFILAMYLRSTRSDS